MSFRVSIDGADGLEVRDFLGGLPWARVIMENDGQPVAPGGFPVGRTRVHVDELSARGVELEYDGYRAHVRVGAASSPEDYQLGLTLARVVGLGCDARLRVAGAEPLTVERFQRSYDVEWARRHGRAALNRVLSRATHAPLTLTGARRPLEVGPRLLAQLPGDAERAATVFFERFRRLQYLDREVLVSIPPRVAGDTTQRRAGVAVIWEGVPVVLSPQARVVVALGGDGAPDERLRVRFDTFVQTVGERCTWLGDGALHVPAMAGAEWRAFTLALAPHTIGSNVCAAGPRPPTTDPVAVQERFSRRELEHLAYAPFIVFAMFARASGRMPERAMRRFNELLSSRGNELVLDLLCQVGKAPSEIVDELLARAPDLAGELRRIAALMEARLPAMAVANFKRRLISIGREIEHAGGPGVARGAAGTMSTIATALDVKLA